MKSLVSKIWLALLVLVTALGVTCPGLVTAQIYTNVIGLPISQLPAIGTNRLTGSDLLPYDNYEGGNLVTVKIPFSNLATNIANSVITNLPPQAFGSGVIVPPLTASNTLVFSGDSWTTEGGAYGNIDWPALLNAMPIAQNAARFNVATGGFTIASNHLFMAASVLPHLNNNAIYYYALGANNVPNTGGNLGWKDGYTNGAQMAAAALVDVLAARALTPHVKFVRAWLRASETAEASKALEDYNSLMSANTNFESVLDFSPFYGDSRDANAFPDGGQHPNQFIQKQFAAAAALDLLGINFSSFHQNPGVLNSVNIGGGSATNLTLVGLATNCVLTPSMAVVPGLLISNNQPVFQVAGASDKSTGLQIKSGNSWWAIGGAENAGLDLQFGVYYSGAWQPSPFYVHRWGGIGAFNQLDDTMGHVVLNWGSGSGNFQIDPTNGGFVEVCRNMGNGLIVCPGAAHAFLKDGSGFLCANKVKWDTSGNFSTSGNMGANNLTVTNNLNANTATITNLSLAGQFGAITQFIVPGGGSNSVVVPLGATYFVSWNTARNLGTLIWTNGYGVGVPVTVTNSAWPAFTSLILKSGWVLSLWDTSGYQANGIYYSL